MVMDSVIEFDSKVTEKDLLRFKFYHKYHTISGMAEILLALILIVLAVISAGKDIQDKVRRQKH